MITVHDGVTGGTDLDLSVLDPSHDHPLYNTAVDQALALCDLQAGPQHVKLTLAWEKEDKEK